MKKRVLVLGLVVLLSLGIVASVVHAPPPPPPPPPPPDFDDQAAAAQPPAGTTSGGGGTSGGGSTSRGGGVPGADYSYKLPSSTATAQPAQPAQTQPTPSYQQPQYQPPQYTPPVQQIPFEEGSVGEKWWDPWVMPAIAGGGGVGVLAIAALIWKRVRKKRASLQAAIPDSIKLYISTNLKNGYPVERIRDALIGAGWPPQLIQEAALAVQREQFQK